MLRINQNWKLFLCLMFSDNSKINAQKYLDESGVGYKFLHSNYKHEIFCNNLALVHATGYYNTKVSEQIKRHFYLNILKI